MRTLIGLSCVLSGLALSAACSPTPDVDDGGSDANGDQNGAGGNSGTCDAMGSIDAGTSGPLPVARIVLSSSTNTPEVFVVVYDDGSAERTVGSYRYDGGVPWDPMSYPAGSPEVQQFLLHLAAIGDVSAIPTGRVAEPGTTCAKSASFYTTTQVTVGCKTSGDLQCLVNATAQGSALAQDCDILTGKSS